MVTNILVAQNVYNFTTGLMNTKFKIKKKSAISELNFSRL